MAPGAGVCPWRCGEHRDASFVCWRRHHDKLIKLKLAVAGALVVDWYKLKLLKFLRVLVVVKAENVARRLVVDDVVVTVVRCALDGINLCVGNQKLFLPTHVDEAVRQVVAVRVGAVDDTVKHIVAVCAVARVHTQLFETWEVEPVLKINLVVALEGAQLRGHRAREKPHGVHDGETFEKSGDFRVLVGQAANREKPRDMWRRDRALAMGQICGLQRHHHLVLLVARDLVPSVTHAGTQKRSHPAALYSTTFAATPVPGFILHYVFARRP